MLRGGCRSWCDNRSEPIFADGRRSVDADCGGRKRSRRARGGVRALAGARRARLRARRPRAAGTRTRSRTTASRSTRASSSTTSGTTRCSAGSSGSSGSRRTPRTCPSRSVAAAAGSSTPAGGRSRSRGTPRARAFLSLFWEIGRWLRTRARPATSRSRSPDYLDEHGYSQRFRRHFLVPLTSALWSTAPGRALEFPAAYAIRFFDNHGMLGFGRFKWRTVTGGSRTYVDAIAARLGDRLRLGSGVRSLRRTPDGVELRVGRRRRAVRPRRGRDARRRGARAARGPDRGRAPRARRASRTRRTRRRSTPTRASSRARGARARRGTTVSATTAGRRSRTT